MQQDYPHVKMTSLTPDNNRLAIVEAKAIAGTPSASHPKSLRRWAWAALKAERGEVISQRGLNRVLARQNVHCYFGSTSINQIRYKHIGEL